MAQYGRPDSTITETNWSGGYTQIDETPYSDSDYITGSNDANGTAEYGLSDVTDPSSGSGHVVRFRAWQENKTKVRTLNAYLYQGTTLISSYPSTITLVKGTPTAYSWNLSSGEADSISDYTALRVRFVSGGDVGIPASSRSSVYVSWAEFECPSAAAVYEESLTLSRVLGLSTLPEALVSLTLSLARYIGLSGAGGIVQNEVVSLQRSLGLQVASGLIAEALLSLHRTSGLAVPVPEVLVSEALNLGRLLGLSPVGTAELTLSVVLSRTSGLETAGGIIVEDSVILSRLSGLSVTGQRTVEEAISLGILKGVSLSPTLVAEVEATLTRTLGFGVVVGSVVSVNVDLARTLGLADVVQVLSEASLTLERLLGLVASGSGEEELIPGVVVVGDSEPPILLILGLPDTGTVSLEDTESPVDSDLEDDGNG